MNLTAAEFIVWLDGYLSWQSNDAWEGIPLLRAKIKEVRLNEQPIKPSFVHKYRESTDQVARGPMTRGLAPEEQAREMQFTKHSTAQHNLNLFVKTCNN
jgi:hypothetical protein